MPRFDVLVTGGSSPLGDVVVPRLIAEGITVAVTARTDASAALLGRTGATVVRHDLRSGQGVASVRAGVVLHAAGIRLAAEAVTLADDVGAKHLVVVSSASATAFGHPARDEILASEAIVSRLASSAAILRPTMIYGGARDRNVRRLYDLAMRLRRVPVLSGGGLIMPVLADDLAEALVEAFHSQESYVRPVAGPLPVRIGDVMDEICSALDRKRIPVRVSIGALSRVAVRFGTHHGNAFHALQMLSADRVVETPAQAGFNYCPTSLHDGITLATSRYARANRAFGT